MSFVCEDLPAHGVILLPPSHPEFAAARASLESRIGELPEEHIPGEEAVLLNRAAAGIAALAVIWYFEYPDGRVVSHSFRTGTSPSVLLPFGMSEKMLRVNAYRNLIFAGSSRLLLSTGDQLGNNMDVRPPDEVEDWKGGWGVGRGGSTRTTPLTPRKLSIDGVFFEDGGFAGPNLLGSWEHTVAAAESYLEIARRYANGDNLDTLFDPTMPPPVWHRPGEPVPIAAIRTFEEQLVHSRIGHMRRAMGEEEARRSIATWLTAPVPRFYRL